jgi:hypothetical protein
MTASSSQEFFWAIATFQNGLVSNYSWLDDHWAKLLK